MIRRCALILRNADGLAIEVVQEIKQRREDALKLSKTIQSPLTSAFDHQDTIDARITLKKLVKEVEDSRVEVKAPVLTFGRLIDDTAKRFVVEIESEELRLKKLCDDYERVKQEEERKRLDEIQRQADLRAKELARIAVEQARIEREQRAEAERLERERIELEQQQAKQRAEAEAARKQAEFDREYAESAPEREHAAAAQREAERIQEEQNRIANEQRIERERIAETQRLEQQQKIAELNQQAEAAKQVTAPTMVRESKPVGQSVKRVPKFEVLDVVAVLGVNPDLVSIEIKPGEVTKAMRGGMTECRGLRLWWETETGVKA